MYKRLLLSTIIVGIMSILIGCVEGDSRSESREYKYSEDSKFIIVHKEKVKDGTVNGLEIYTLVHRETKVMYMHTVKFQAGYGVGLEVMLDEKGDPLLYEGELDS